MVILETEIFALHSFEFLCSWLPSNLAPICGFVKWRHNTWVGLASERGIEQAEIRTGFAILGKLEGLASFDNFG